MKVITKTISPGSQDVFYTEILGDEKNKLRIRIRSDAYIFQSFAVVEVFSDLRWNEIAHIPYGIMKTQAGLVYKPKNQGLQESNFEADRNELFRQAVEILN